MKTFLGWLIYAKWSLSSGERCVYFIFVHAEELEGPWSPSKNTGNLENQMLSLQIIAGTTGAWCNRGDLGRGGEGGGAVK